MYYISKLAKSLISIWLLSTDYDETKLHLVFNEVNHDCGSSVRQYRLNVYIKLPSQTDAKLI